MKPGLGPINITLVGGIAAIGALAGSAHAAVTVYNSQAAFDAAVPTAATFGFNAGGTVHVIPNPSKFHGLSFSSDSTAADAATGGVPILWLIDQVDTPTYGKDFLSYQNTQVEDIGDIVTGPAGKTAIGFTFGTYVAPGPATVTLSTGDTFAITATGAESFIGFTSPTPITKVTIDFPTGYSFDLTSVSLSVPEPASWAMMLLGLGGLGAAMRLRRGAPAAV